jgi:hypothetical protein
VPDLITLLVLADRLTVSVAELTNDLPVPLRRVGTAQVLDMITLQPGISTDALAASLELPFWYAAEIVLYLESTGAIVPTRSGWQPAA